MKITPAMRVRGSNVAKPWTSAATDDPTPDASTTSTTGAASNRATCAVDAKSPPTGDPGPLAPSKSPITPSITATSAGFGVVAPCRNSVAMRSSPTSHGSRLRPGRPAARAW